MSNLVDWPPDADYEVLKTTHPFGMTSDQWTRSVKQAIDEAAKDQEKILKGDIKCVP